MMEITPALGIGDILIYLMYFKQNKIKDIKVNINENLIKQHRLEPEKFIEFVIFLFKSFNKDININLVNIEITVQYPDNYIMDNNYLFDDMTIEKYIPITEEYIVFHTKARFDKYQPVFDREIGHLNNFLKNFKSKYTIVILGEKEVEKNIEQKTHNINSLYDNFRVLNDNNKIIDLTKDFLYSGNDSIEDFVKDINIINNAKMNITFGWGGPLNLCQSFSKNNICYVGKLEHSLLNNYQKNNKNLYRFINEFTLKIKDALSI